jgi:disulfide bond formation protein DsbB
LEVLLRSIILLSFFVVVVGILLGGSLVEWIAGYKPCILCYLQRFALILIALCLLIEQGVSAYRNIGLGVMTSLFGLGVSLRHNMMKFCSSEHIQPVILGKSLPQWTFIAFVLSVFGFILLLFVKQKAEKRSNYFFKTSCFSLILIVLASLISSLINLGLFF